MLIEPSNCEFFLYFSIWCSFQGGSGHLHLKCQSCGWVLSLHGALVSHRAGSFPVPRCGKWKTWKRVNKGKRTSWWWDSKVFQKGNEFLCGENSTHFANIVQKPNHCHAHNSIRGIVNKSLFLAFVTHQTAFVKCAVSLRTDWKLLCYAETCNTHPKSSRNLKNICPLLWCQLR